MPLRRNRFLQKTLSLFTDADLSGTESVRPETPTKSATYKPEPAEDVSIEWEMDYRSWYDTTNAEDEDDEDAADVPDDDDDDERDEQSDNEAEQDDELESDLATITPIPQLLNLYDELNRQYFNCLLPPCEMKWSRRLTRAAGTIRCERRLITLSVPLLVDPYRKPGVVFEICGVTCASYETALREILKHEMIHMWLFVQKLPYGHTPAFRAKARAIGQPRTRHNIALPPPTSGWIYRCDVCATEMHRRRRFSRPVACLTCCKVHNRGKYDERFKLKGRRL